MAAQAISPPMEQLSSLLKARLDALEANRPLTPGGAEALYDFCHQQVVQGRYREALAYFMMLASLKPSEVKYLQGLAHVQQALKQFDEAVAVYRMLDLLDPLNPRYTLSMAECLVQQQRIGSARELLEDVIEFCEARDAQDPLLERARLLYQRIQIGVPHASQH